MHMYTQHDSALCIQAMIIKLIYLSFCNPQYGHCHRHRAPISIPLVSLPSTTNSHLTSSSMLRSSEMAPQYFPPSLDCSPAASLRVQKPHTYFTLSALLLTDVDHWEGRSDDTDACLRFGVCISEADPGGADDGWVEILVVVRCRRANRMNLGKNKRG
jgi:hypothetical protein